MMDRRVFLASLFVLHGCSRKEERTIDENATRVTPSASGLPNGDPPSASAQPQAKIPSVSFLVFGTRNASAAAAPAAAPMLIRNRLTELGYVEGKTIIFEERYADGDPQRLTQLAHEAVAGQPDVIVAIAVAATAAARQATSTIPIVMAHAGDPVGSGLAASLAHPGGNVTGTTSMTPELGFKQVELLRELVPGLRRLGVLANPTNAGAPPLVANVNEAARRHNVSTVVAEVTRPEDFDNALRLLRDARPDALLVMIEPMIYQNRARVLDFAATNQVPASFDVGREIVRQGGLISYGPVLTTHYAVVADYVDKILKGAKPGDLPVQQPTQFALAINLTTAKALGLTIPQSLLLRADEVIR
jgi:putative ABC transport system substrate-binding protein